MYTSESTFLINAVYKYKNEIIYKMKRVLVDLIYIYIIDAYMSVLKNRIQKTFF